MTLKVGLHVIKDGQKRNQFVSSYNSSLQSWRTREWTWEKHLRFALEITTNFGNGKPWFSGSTLPETKIWPETLGLEVSAYFEGLDMFSFREDLIRSNVCGWKSPWMQGKPKTSKGNRKKTRFVTASNFEWLISITYAIYLYLSYHSLLNYQNHVPFLIRCQQFGKRP